REALRVGAAPAAVGHEGLPRPAGRDLEADVDPPDRHIAAEDPEHALAEGVAILALAVELPGRVEPPDAITGADEEGRVRTPADVDRHPDQRRGLAEAVGLALALAGHAGRGADHHLGLAALALGLVVLAL